MTPNLPPHANWEPDCIAAGVTNPQDAKRLMIQAFVTALYGAYKSGNIELRCIAPKWNKTLTIGSLSYFFDIERTLSDPLNMELLVHRAFVEEAWGRDVYIGVLPRRYQTNGKKSNVVTCSHFAWIDLDDKCMTRELGLKVLNAKADIIVETGGGLHGYVQLSAPVTLSKTDEIKKFESRVKSWQNSISPGCDPTQNIDRILRLPGTTRYKEQDNPLRVRLLKVPGM